MLFRIFACFSTRFANRLRKCCDALRPRCFAIYTSFSTLRAPFIITIEHFLSKIFRLGLRMEPKRSTMSFCAKSLLSIFISREFDCAHASDCNLIETAAELLLLEMIAQEIMSCRGSENYFSYALGVLRQPKTLNHVETFQNNLNPFLIQLYQEF